MYTHIRYICDGLNWKKRHFFFSKIKRQNFTFLSHFEFQKSKIMKSRIANKHWNISIVLQIYVYHYYFICIIINIIIIIIIIINIIILIYFECTYVLSSDRYKSTLTHVYTNAQICKCLYAHVFICISLHLYNLQTRIIYSTYCLAHSSIFTTTCKYSKTWNDCRSSNLSLHIFSIA